MPNRRFLNDNILTGDACEFAEASLKNVILQDSLTFNHCNGAEFNLEENNNKFPSEDGGVEYFR